MKEWQGLIILLYIFLQCNRQGHQMGKFTKKIFFSIINAFFVEIFYNKKEYIKPKKNEKKIWYLMG